jgi:hypothetical protein
MHSTRLLAGSALALAFVIGACNSDEATNIDEHNPDNVTFIVDGDTLTTDTLVLNAGVDNTVRIIFTEGTDNLDDVEAEHYSLLTFTPSTSITATRRASHHFRQDVVVGAVSGQTGDLDIGFGHDTLADEYTLSLHYKVQ